jgi:hypothetical protein
METSCFYRQTTILAPEFEKTKIKKMKFYKDTNRDNKMKKKKIQMMTILPKYDKRFFNMKLGDHSIAKLRNSLDLVRIFSIERKK